MPIVALLALLAFGALEIYVLLLVAAAIGVGLTILLLAAKVVVGIWLMRHEGGRTIRMFQQTVRLRGSPVREIGDGVLIVVGGVLVIVPGFVSGALGLLLLLPPTRTAVRWAGGLLIGRRIRQAPEVIRVESERGHQVIDGEIE